MTQSLEQRTLNMMNAVASGKLLDRGQRQSGSVMMRMITFPALGERPNVIASEGGLRRFMEEPLNMMARDAFNAFRIRRGSQTISSMDPMGGRPRWFARMADMS